MPSSSHLTFGVVLSGCGVQDGSEIHEATLTLLALDTLNIESACFAPDIPQLRVADHRRNMQIIGERRAVLTESARIARGRIQPLSNFSAQNVDGLIFPGGMGAALNLSDFALKGQGITVQPEVRDAILAMHSAKKPLGFICISPVLAACVLGKHRPTLTVGSECDVSKAIEAMGARHVTAAPDEIAVDAENQIVSAPAYMTAKRIGAVALGIQRLVQKMADMAQVKTH